MSIENIKDQIKKQLPINYKILEECNAILAGGALTSLYTRKEINDFDIYFPSMDMYMQALEAVVEEYVYLHVLAKTNKAVMFVTEIGGVAVQFIYDQFYSSVEDIFSSFDFYINMAAYSFKDDNLVLHDKFLTNLASRSLEFNTNTKYPIISALRVDKYKQRGYDITKKEFLKVMLAVNKLKISGWKDFKEQLSGLYGQKLELSINEEEDFSLEKALELLESLQTDIYNSGYNIEQSQDTDLREVVIEWQNKRLIQTLKDRITNNNVKFYKVVNSDNSSLYSSFSRLKYEIGSVVNGGSKGIFVHSGGEVDHYLYSSRKVIELSPVGVVDIDSSFGKISVDEITLLGDWKVTGVWTKEEWEGNK